MHPTTRGRGGGWHKASVSDCLPLAAPIGLSPLLILTLCGPERVLVVSTEPLDDLSCLWGGGGVVPGEGGWGSGRPLRLSLLADQPGAHIQKAECHLGGGRARGMPASALQPTSKTS